MTFTKHFLSSFKPWQYPMIAGSIIGTPCGVYSGYKDTRKYPFEYNVLGTILGGVGGFFNGGLLGFLWPISIPIAISRNYKLQIKE
jgi:uncharacterized membrane protein YfcA